MENETGAYDLDRGVASRQVRMLPDTVDAEVRTVEVVFTTGASVRRRSWDPIDEILDVGPGAVRMHRLNAGAPFLTNHRGSVEATIGVVERAWIAGSEGRALVRFSKDPEAERVFAKISEGVLRNVSVGYQVHRVLIEEKDGAPDVHRVVDWEPYEISVVAMGADPGAQFRAHNFAPAVVERRAANEGQDMPQETQPAPKPSRAAPIAAPEDTAANPEGTRAVETPSIDLVAIRAEAGALERKRIADISGTARNLGLSGDVVQRLIDEGVAVAEANSRLIEERARVDAAGGFVAHDGQGFMPAPNVNNGSARAADKVTPYRLIRALAAGRGDPVRAARHAASAWGDELTARALTAGNATGAGFLVGEQMASEIIELLRPRTVIRRMGPRVLQIRGSFVQNRQTAGANVNYVGEGQAATASQQTLDQLNLTPRKLIGLVPVSNDLIRYSSVSADMFVRDDLIESFQVKEDQTFLRSDGKLATKPKGLRYLMASSHVIAANGTVNIANVTTDLGKLMLKVEEANISLDGARFIMSPRSAHYLADVRDSNGVKAFPSVSESGTYRGYAIEKTTSVPNNLGGGTESEIYFGQPSEIMVGDAEEIMIEVSADAAYDPGDGNLVSAFSRDEVLMRAIAEHDINMRHPEGWACLTEVTWGA